MKKVGSYDISITVTKALLVSRSSPSLTVILTPSVIPCPDLLLGY